MSQTPSPQPRVFIVDDDQAVRSALRLLAMSYGWDATAFPSAEAFLHANPEPGDGCLILDLAMPGMNGVQLQKELQRRGIRLPTVVVTAHPDNSLANAARQAGAARILPKPFAQDELRECVETAVSAH